MKSKYLLWLLSVPCFILIYLNGIQNNSQFKIDTVTFGLLILAFLPLLQQFVSTIKAGGIELQFKNYIREVSRYEQILIFLDAISSNQEWTFYNPRSGEEDLGKGLKSLIDDLAENHKKDLNKKIHDWFKSKNNNHKWFAAEIVGYAHDKIDKKFEVLCLNSFSSLNNDERWEHWQLNCLWAYSRFWKYEPLISRLRDTKNIANRLWMIEALDQMRSEESENTVIIDEFNKVLGKDSN